MSEDDELDMDIKSMHRKNELLCQTVERLKTELTEAKKETDKYRQWHEHVGKSMKYYRDDMLPATQQEAMALREALEQIERLAFSNMIDRHNAIDELLEVGDVAKAALAATPPAAEEQVVI